MKDSRMRGSNSLTYADAGVDIEAGNALVDAIKPAVRSTARAGSMAQIGGFGGLFDLKEAGYSDPVLVAANDGVGTKLRLAIETGIHDTVGIDLVAMCVNDLVVQGAEPLFFLDYFATGKLEVAVATRVVEGIAAGCRQAGCALIGGETAEMPGMYSSNDYDLAGFAVGAVERDSILPSEGMEAGDVLIGLTSSGLHSNGFSLVRRVIEQTGLGLDAEAPFAQGQLLGESLLAPTRIYVKPILAAIRETGSIAALAHITGGGLVENLPRVLPEGLCGEIDLGAIKSPPVFGWLAKTGGIEDKEMLRTFNCGVGMVAVVPRDKADMVAAALTAAGEEATVIGRLVPRDGEAVSVKGRLKL